MIRENNPYVNTTWVWTYDGAGNILSKKEYAYTTDVELGTARSTINYGYPSGEEAWGDLLTSYNGQTLSYRGGNLIDDGTWEYAWK